MSRTLDLQVKPNARVSLLEAVDGGPWRASLKSPPADGKANAELVALVAEHFGCPRAAVTIKTGAGSRLKRVVVAA